MKRNKRLMKRRLTMIKRTMDVIGIFASVAFISYGAYILFIQYIIEIFKYI